MLNKLKANRLLSNAQSISSKAGPEKAIAFYEGALKNHPGHSGLHLQFGLTLLKLHNYSRAQIEFEEAYKLAPNNPVIPMFRGATLLALDKYEEALEYFNATLEKSPDNRLCSSLKGLALLHLDRREEGAAILADNFASGNPLIESMVFYYCESKCISLQIDSLLLFEKALSPLGWQTVGDPQEHSAFFAAARTAAGLLDSGLNSFWKRVTKPFRKEPPEFTDLYFSGMNHFHGHRLEQAKGDLEKCTRLDYRPPPHKGAQMAEALYWLQSYASLSRILPKYFPDEYDDDPEVLLLRAKIAIHENRLEKAEALLKKIKHEPGLQFWPAYLKGIISLRRGNSSEAKTAFGEAADLLGLISTKTYFQAMTASIA